ncbi:ferredoxin hydrogenase small subunit [Desulfobaculum xiamenense]|uniref:Ferredoxin hydrogenase small subunit n=1 Tax=Desulfobaculum xiamenense TaxID=995050 RepID=A0A846QJ22_9BACT|nr:iron hydrogenase small subunit [Desulfobaculum xiamenense]NJB68161.1 ferredoxin hydrogenase small subunit [Desulfobaculum xiamenense]
MQNVAKLTRRGFIKAAGIACGYAVLGVNLTREAAAAAMEFIGLRQASVYNADANIYKMRKSQENPTVMSLYAKDGFLSEGPCGHKSHHLLHTHYFDRAAKVQALKDKGVELKF